MLWRLSVIFLTRTQKVHFNLNEISTNSNWQLGGATTHRSGNSSKRQLIEVATHRSGNSSNLHIVAQLTERMSQYHFFDELSLRWFATRRACFKGVQIIECMRKPLKMFWWMVPLYVGLMSCHPYVHLVSCSFDELLLRWVAASMNCRSTDNQNIYFNLFICVLSDFLLLFLVRLGPMLQNFLRL